MNRLGFSWQDDGVSEAADVFGLAGIAVKGVYTHCPAAGAEDASFLNAQADRLLGFVQRLRKRGLDVPCVHMANSSTLLQHPEYALDMARIASLVFGLNPPVASGAMLDVHPMVSVRAKIVQARWIQSGEGVSYGLRWRASRPSRIGVAPLGHVDIPIRNVSNGYALVHGARAPIVGTVCMDQLMVDLTDTDAKEGDELTFLGKSCGEEITLADLASRCGIEPFRFLCMLSARLPRIYLRDGTQVLLREGTSIV